MHFSLRDFSVSKIILGIKTILLWIELLLFECYYLLYLLCNNGIDVILSFQIFDSILL